jgi:ribonuclease P protein component
MSSLPPRRYRFGASSKIKRRRDFVELKALGKRAALGCLVANWQSVAGASRSRLGVVTSGRIGPAVVRNRARRLMRESFRLHEHEFAQPLDLVLVARPSISGKQFPEVERDFLTILHKAGLLKLVVEASKK